MTTEPPTYVLIAKYKHFINSPDGDGFWLTCDRPFEEAATDMLRSAIRASRPVAIFGNKRRPTTPAPVAVSPSHYHTQRSL